MSSAEDGVMASTAIRTQSWLYLPVGSRSNARHPQSGRVYEYALKDDLDDAWAVRPLELVHERSQTMLLLRDPGGEPLDRLLGSPVEVGRFLRLAVALSGALGRLHQRGLVHKDIKPTNILVDSATDQVWLTGFGIAIARAARASPVAAEPPGVHRRNARRIHGCPNRPVE